MKRVLAILIGCLLAILLLAIALSDPAPVDRGRAWLLLVVTVLVAAFFASREPDARSSKGQRITSGWQGQSRGTARALLGIGALAQIFGFLYDASNQQGHYGLLFVSIAAMCLGVGIHRNVRVVHAYFGRRLGWILNALQFLLPAIAFVLFYAAELVTDPATKWVLRFLSVIPFLFLYLVIWAPLARFTPGEPRPDEATIGKLG